MSKCAKPLVAVLAAVIALASQPATAQQPPASHLEELRSQNDAICVVSERELGEGEAPQVIAACGGRAFVLGQADSFEAFENRGLNATVIDLVLGSERRVLLISFPDGETGQPLLEDITADLARSAGRNVRADLKDLALDFSTFAEDGEVGASQAGRSGRINIGQQISAEVSRRGS